MNTSETAPGALSQATLAEKIATSRDPQAQYRVDILANWPITTGARVLELGCGQGDSTVALAEAIGETGHVDAVDPGSLDYGTSETCHTSSTTLIIYPGSPETLGHAHDRISAGPLGRRISWIQAEPLAFLSANPGAPRYDVAVLAHSLWYFSSPALILETLRLDPGNAPS